MFDKMKFKNASYTTTDVKQTPVTILFNVFYALFSRLWVCLFSFNFKYTFVTSIKLFDLKIVIDIILRIITNQFTLKLHFSVSEIVSFELSIVLIGVLTDTPDVSAETAATGVVTDRPELFRVTPISGDSNFSCCMGFRFFKLKKKRYFNNVLHFLKICHYLIRSLYFMHFCSLVILNCMYFFIKKFSSYIECFLVRIMYFFIHNFSYNCQ